MTTASPAAPEAPILDIDQPDAPPPPTLPVTEADVAPDLAELAKLSPEDRVLGRAALGSVDVEAKLASARRANATFASTIIRRILAKLDRLRVFRDDAATRHQAAARDALPTDQLDALEAERTLIHNRLTGESEALEEARKREADAKITVRQADAALADVKKKHKLPDAAAVAKLRAEIEELESKLAAARGRFQDHVVAEDAAARARESLSAMTANVTRWETTVSDSKRKADESLQAIDLRLGSHRIIARRLQVALNEDHDATRLLQRLENQLDNLTLEGRTLPKGSTVFDLVQGLA